ncbi:MAG: hypothetical protein U5R49_27250 [Deltaproteobacteria bacterium]|nr:hypothetical protein [Deltaproteobacteria bacterium]
MNEKNKEKVKGTWLKVFCPEARCLSEEEIASLPEEKKGMAEENESGGLWLEVFCPDDSCLREEERVNIPVKQASDEETGKGTWLRLFCPEDHCLVREPTDVP